MTRRLKKYLWQAHKATRVVAGRDEAGMPPPGAVLVTDTTSVDYGRWIVPLRTIEGDAGAGQGNA